MTTNNPPPLTRERNLILIVLLGLAVAAWVLIIWQSMAQNGPMGLTMGMSGPVFVVFWVVMMVAMMFPAAATMTLTFARVQANKRAQEQPFVPTWIFVGGYLLVWTIPGVLAWAAARWLENVAGQSMWVMDNTARISGGLLLLAGLYQLTPLKHACLTKCRHPLTFILQSWRDGSIGAVRMGVEHGLFCLGCCWPLFVILFPLGIMNVAAMALITLVIVAEKSWAWGLWVSRLAAVFLIGVGAARIVFPSVWAIFGAM